ncbi:hypothetical protein QBC42DRAFT_295378 [Cladorrhinum samala]|uniref:Uncharacterized protein n=1 Tax=Cladorrhinum samala TaxID=585594 RepID=A0AAV9HX56_9PEZI|nr:hypothetical protein QBC42DRAFT_295378 [Cladorrhinum samala]
MCKGTLTAFYCPNWGTSACPSFKESSSSSFSSSPPSSTGTAAAVVTIKEWVPIWFERRWECCGKHLDYQHCSRCADAEADDTGTTTTSSLSGSGSSKSEERRQVTGDPCVGCQIGEMKKKEEEEEREKKKKKKKKEELGKGEVKPEKKGNVWW